MNVKSYLSVAPEVHDALTAGRPVVALESTIITHGMPYPQNLEMARKVEAEVRAIGAVPATIAIMDGKFRVGLEAGQTPRFIVPNGPYESRASVLTINRRSRAKTSSGWPSRATRRPRRRAATWRRCWSPATSPARQLPPR